MYQFRRRIAVFQPYDASQVRQVCQIGNGLFADGQKFVAATGIEKGKHFFVKRRTAVQAAVDIEFAYFV